MKNEILNTLERLHGYVKISNSYKNISEIQHSRYKDPYSSSKGCAELVTATYRALSQSWSLEVRCEQSESIA